MVKRRHNMPFGATLLDDGRVRFRLWAPQAGRVDVCLGGGEEHAALQMAAEPDGWFGLVTELATAGTRYCYHIDGAMEVPDPASRFQPEDVHGFSEVINPHAHEWRDVDWHGRPWEEAVIYELHVGGFTPQGDFAGVRGELDYLAGMGITAVELMPVADFPGERNWGYDGAYPYAPDSRYGGPEDLKALIEAAHKRGLMVFLDVVYNHFGPEGNYLRQYAPQFFSQRHHTPWGEAINFDGQHSDVVRQFFIHNALYWLEEYHFDGLRLDAVHTIADDSRPHILTELANRVRDSVGDERRVHLILENDHNAAGYLARDARNRPRWYTAQWNDDIHHALHVLLSGETDGYYRDYAGDPLRHLQRCLAEGFAWQGEASPCRDGNPRGEASDHLPPAAFVGFLQNHDQVGNRAFGERIAVLTTPERLHAATALLLLAPSPPLLFMGQEWSSERPFPFFCDFGADIAGRVMEGRRREFARFPPFSDAAVREKIPDPQATGIFESAVLDWREQERPGHRQWLQRHRELLALRQSEVIPRLRDRGVGQKSCTRPADTVLSAYWRLGDGSDLFLIANLGDETVTGIERPAAPLLYSTHGEDRKGDGPLPPWSVSWYLLGEEEQYE